ncbi:MAG: hypothetical protein Q9191_003446 [Dirinaria sp. TL-2023a]
MDNQLERGTNDDKFLPFTHAGRSIQTSKKSESQSVGVLRTSWSQELSGRTGKGEGLGLRQFECGDLDPQISLLRPATPQIAQQDRKSNLYSSIGSTDMNSVRSDRGNTVEKRSTRYSIKKDGLPRSTEGLRKVKAAAGDEHKREDWQIQKQALAKKFGQAGWTPRKRLSPDALDGIRALHVQYPAKYTTSVLAEQFEVSPEAIRRILKSKWKPTETEEASRRQRWDRRGAVIWSQKAESGIKPPKKWRQKGIGRDQIPLHKQRLRDDSQNRLATEEQRSSALDASSVARTSVSLSSRIL